VSIVIERVSVATPEAKELLVELDRILSAAYERDQRHALSIEQPFQSDVHFFIARLMGEAAWPSATVTPKSSACTRASRPAGAE